MSNPEWPYDVRRRWPDGGSEASGRELAAAIFAARPDVKAIGLHYGRIGRRDHELGLCMGEQYRDLHHLMVVGSDESWRV